jgi:hypothetical protein
MIKILNKNLYLIFLFSYILILLSNKYIPNYDESFQIESALRLYNFSKYEYTWNLPTSYNIPYFQKSSAWPIGYSAFIYLFLKLNFTLNSTIILFKVFLILINTFIWSKICELEFTGSQITSIYKILFSIFIISISNSTTDMIVILFFGIISYRILNKNFNQKISNYFIVGLLLSFSLIFKYTTIFLFPSIFIYLLYTNYKNDIKTILIKLFYISIPLLIVSILIFSNNVTKQQNLITPTNLNPFNKFYFITNLNYLNLITVILVDSLTFPLLIKNGINYLLSSNYFKILPFSFSIFIILYKYNIKLKHAKFFYIIIFLYIITITIFSFIFFTKPHDWLPAFESRYYQPLVGILLIIYLKKFETIIQCKSFFTKFFLISSFTLLCIFFIIFCYKKISYNTIVNNNITSVKNYIKRINSTYKIDNNITFLDDNYFPAFPRDGVHNFYNINKINNFNLSNNHTNIISYVIVSNYSFKYLPIIKNNKNLNFLLFTSTNNYHHINISNNTTLFWKVYR